MISLRQLFLNQVAQTSPTPIMLEVDRASGVFIYDVTGKRYYDMNSGIAVSSLGHCHPKVISAIQHQASQYLHTMVYGEHVQSPQVQLAQLLLSQIDEAMDRIYYLMSGTEATELAMKLSKRYTRRYKIVACRNAYHGSTQGAESLRSDESYKAFYRPLLPGIVHINFNNTEDLVKIDDTVAGVIIEVVQGEAGVILPDHVWLRHLALRCKEVGALLIIDEIQTGFGRTGQLFAHLRYDISPDILLLGKAMGGGMPISAVVSRAAIMSSIVHNPSLGHITTFGGHPVSCAAALAGLEALLQGNLIDEVSVKSSYVIKRLSAHPLIKEVRNSGLLMAVEVTHRKHLKHIVRRAYELGVIVDWFLFNDRSFRLAPPLIVSIDQLREVCDVLIRAFDYAEKQYSI